MTRDDRAIAALRRDPGAKVPEVELVVFRDHDHDQGRDIELVLDDGLSLTFDLRDLLFAAEEPEPPSWEAAA